MLPDAVRMFHRNRLRHNGQGGSVGTGGWGFVRLTLRLAGRWHPGASALVLSFPGAEGGWSDWYKNAVPALLAGMSAPVRGITGPWRHQYPHFAVPDPRIGFRQLPLRCWDRRLKRIETGVGNDPAFRAWLMGGVRPAAWHDHRPGRWIAGPVWPAPIPEQTFHIAGPDLPGPSAVPVSMLNASPRTCGAQGGGFCAGLARNCRGISAATMRRRPVSIAAPIPQ